MTEQKNSPQESLRDRLASRGYWPARAARAVAEGKCSQAVEICREYLPENPDLVSGRLIYGLALQLSGQLERAEEQFQYVLAFDPDNLAALKSLADIRFAAGDELPAMANYRRIQEIDPYTRGLCCEVSIKLKPATRVISIKRGPEGLEKEPAERSSLRPIPFLTETIGDLYLAQGHHRLAAEIFRALAANTGNPRILQKLQRAESRVKEKGN